MGTQLHTDVIVPSDSILATLPANTKAASAKTKKKLIRRTDRDYSQNLRRGYQASFLILNAWLGAQFYFWVRNFETGGESAYVSRPAGVEGWLPIAGMMNLKYFLVTGHVPSLHPAAMFLLITFLSIAFLFRKAFCSWLCPVGTISEYLGKLGKKLFGQNFHLARWADIPLRGLKYLLLGFFAWAVSSMSANAIAAFMRSPYGIVADLKMLNFFRFIGPTGLIVLGVLVVASVLVQNFWCRYLCPYGALLGIASLLSPMRIRRNTTTCIDCAKCAKACPSALPVEVGDH
jgi:polyferredoxin